MHKMLKEIQNLNNFFETRTPSSLKECEDKINNSKSGGFVGYIPDFMLKHIPSNKSEMDFFKMFSSIVLLLKKNKITKAKQELNNFFDNNIQFEFEKNSYNGLFTNFGVIIYNNINAPKLFLKVFKNTYKKDHPFHYRHGPYIESANALFINNSLKNSLYFAKFYFANPQEFYMVTEYVDIAVDFTDYKNAFDNLYLKLIQDLNTKEKIVSKFFEKYTGEYISHYQILKSLKGGCFRQLDYKADNFIIYEDENKNKHVKLIDFGYFISYKSEFRTI